MICGKKVVSDLQLCTTNIPIAPRHPKIADRLFLSAIHKLQSKIPSYASSESSAILTSDASDIEVSGSEDVADATLTLGTPTSITK